ncbi:MAG: TolC family protein [Sulfurospirillum sp.]|nr:TolC family protein [Sulfurospirillum sp.]
MHLKKYLSLFIIITLHVVAAENSALLSTLKQQKIDIDKQKNELESDNLRYDWLNPIIGSFSYVNSDQISNDRKTQTLSVSIDQPFFKSGGIYFAIKYAGANREFLRLSTQLSEQNLIKNLIASWLLIKRYDAQIQKQQSLIANAKIDIIRKKEQYESGFLDSSFLDNAILNKSNLEKALLDLQTSRFEQITAFGTLSDSDYKVVQPPQFSLINEEAFLENSLILVQQNINISRNDYLKKMTIANYLPTFSLTAGYFDTSVDTKTAKTDDTYKNFGLKVTMPLISVNRGRTIEIRQLELLKSKLELADLKRSVSGDYKNALNKIQILEQKGTLALSDYELYNSLLVSTQERYDAGEKTIYDVDTLKNSRQMMHFDKLIYDIDIQLALLSLYEKVHGKI